MNRANVCCFTGHRPESLYLYDEEDAVYAHIFKAVEDAIFDRYTVFMCGGCRGGDFLFGEAVAELRNIYPEIRLVCVLPFRGQAELWSGEERNRYADLLDSADEVICLNDKYQKGCMHERNRYMVDRSSLLIAAYNGTKGGTDYTLSYAKKQGLRTVNVLTVKGEISTQLSFE
ncbi:MAG: DUF1273 family protein [Clostridia bacterium]|nr:DUF1273 family protein [Clostridia bacterium]MBQ2319615.1 DUF1273 family protein [Clostridia bacterium]